MTITFQSWMRAVWISLIEPAEIAAKVLTMRFRRDVMWTAMALIAVVNVLLLEIFKFLTPSNALMHEQVLSLSPFSYTAIIGSFLALLAVMLVQAGRIFGGRGTLDGALMLIIWLQAISLTLETIQVALLFISIHVASLFGMISLGAIIWVIINFINVLHGFSNVGKSVLVIAMAMIATGFGMLFVMAFLGVSPPVGAAT